jgi:plastocyanin
MRKEFFVFVVLLSIFLTIGCTSTKNTPTPTPTSTPNVATSQNTTQKIVDVKIAGFAYSPSSVQISVGDKVKWTNFDNVKHDVQGSIFKSALLPQFDSYVFTFTKPGTYNYICSIHPSMQGTITVV